MSASSERRPSASDPSESGGPESGGVEPSEGDAGPADSGSPWAVYRRRRARSEDARRECEGRLVRVGRLRVAAFVAAVAALLGAERTEPAVAVALVGVALLSIIAFGVLVARHRTLRTRERRMAERATVNEEALARLERRWTDLPAVPERRRDRALRDHPYADDLDVVGHASLERLLSTVATGPGARTLRAWLLDGAEPDEVRARQAAVDELADEVEFRQELAVRARLAGLRRDDETEPLVAWTEAEAWLPRHPVLLWTARLVPPATLALGILQLAGVVGGAWWLLGILAGLVFTGSGGGELSTVLERLTAPERALGSYAEPLRFLEGTEFEAERLRAVRDGVHAGSGRASRALRRLEDRVALAEVRHNDLLHAPLQILLFWDVHVLWLLERWRDRSGRGVRSWFRALGEAEALGALSALRFDHPDWSLPELSGEPVFRAEKLGHPLLPPAQCVRNDVELGPPGTFLLVTGSNMSGKSTLLRAVGANAVLAQAGGPVCAEHQAMPALRPVTSMRTRDSLSEGVSQFMAELRRVAMVVEAAGDAEEGRAMALYLLDEPLQGTNEAERREALRIVLRRLLESPAVGAVATHDLRLHRTERLEDAARTVHFTGTVEEVDGELSLRFDHRLRPGPATSTNALDLLRLVGLDGRGRRGDGAPRVDDARDGR